MNISKYWPDIFNNAIEVRRKVASTLLFPISILLISAFTLFLGIGVSENSATSSSGDKSYIFENLDNDQILVSSSLKNFQTLSTSKSGFINFGVAGLGTCIIGFAFGTALGMYIVSRRRSKDTHIS